MATKRKSKARKKQIAIAIKRKGKRKAPAKKKSSGRKKPLFGGYAVNFKGRNETVEQVFGSKPIPPSQMTKKIWAFVKTKKLSNR